MNFSWKAILFLILSVFTASAGVYRLGYFDFIEGVSVKRNFITNGEFEKNQAGATSYDDTSVAIPDNGTGGSASVLSCDHTTSAINGSGSLLISKTGADSRGEGCSIPITIDAGSKYAQLAVEFEYILGSGTFTAGTLTSSSDLEVFLYDVTNSTLIYPDWHRLESNSTTVPFTYYATFPATSSTSYRLIFHSTSTDTDAWTMKVDSIKVSKQATAQGPPVVDLGTSAWTDSETNATTSVTATRVGDRIFIDGVTSVTNTFSGTGFDVTIPAGYSADSTFYGGFSSIPLVGKVIFVDTGTSNSNGTVGITGANTIRLYPEITTGTYLAGTNTTNSVPHSWANTDKIHFNANWKVSGWTSNVSMSNIDSVRPVQARCYRSTNQSINDNTATVIAWDTCITDSHGKMNTSTGVYTVPATGYYNFGASCGTASSGSRVAGHRDALYYRIDGGTSVQIDWRVWAGSVTETFQVTGTDSRYLTIGQTLEILCLQDSSGAQNIVHSNGGITYFWIEKDSGSQRIATQNPVIAIYELNTSSSNLSIADQVEERLDWNSKIKDSHNAVTTGASWSFAAPYPATYEICPNLWWNTTSNMTATYTRVRVDSSVVYYTSYGHGADSENMYGCYTTPLRQGQTVDVVAYQDDSTSAARAVYGAGNARITIKSIGPY